METSQAITITRIRFYKLAASTGTHTAHVWSSDGTVIATQAFTSETSSGWQEVALGSPVAIARVRNSRSDTSLRPATTHEASSL